MDDRIQRIKIEPRKERKKESQEKSICRLNVVDVNLTGFLVLLVRGSVGELEVALLAAIATESVGLVDLGLWTAKEKKSVG